MDASVFDRITKRLAGSMPRRNAVRVFSATSFAALASRFGGDEAVAKKNKKKRCRKRQQTCGGRKKCCNRSGLIKCDIVSEPMGCANLTKKVCCGLDGAHCNPDLDRCDCCGELFCVQYATESLCRSEAT